MSLFQKIVAASFALFCSSAVLPQAQAEDVVKVGMIMSQSGPFGIYGELTKRGVEMFMDETGGKVGNTKIEVIWRDEAGGPERAKTNAQSLIVSEGVQFLAGFNLTPNAAAIAPLISQSKTPTLLLTAAASPLTRQSPYFARLSFTIWQSTYTMAKWAAAHGHKEVVFAYSDYAAGTDGLAAFRKAFEEVGGKITAELAMPLSTTDYGPYIQKIRDMKPKAVYVFTPNGPPSIGFVKAFASYGLQSDGVLLMGFADEMDLPGMGDAAIGVMSVWHYSPDLTNAKNKAFVAAFNKKYGQTELPNFQVVATYDAMHAIADVVKKLGPKFTGDQAMAALKGWKMDSVRGPIEIDAAERDIVQNQYVRRVVKGPPGRVENQVLETMTAVVDPWKVLNPPK
jgi:branched-chain amino acid transport system substrate-binding protein